VVQYKNIWADNGDQLSYIYAGTASTTSELTREGKQGIFGILGHGVKALGRFYNSTFEDDSKQSAINVVLGSAESDLQAADNFMKQTEQKYCTY
jgi:hypothetical protein